MVSTPNGRKLDAALAQLEFMVSLDPYLNETTRHAHIILPPTSPLEHDHYDLAFHVNAMRNTARFSEAVFDKPAGACTTGRSLPSSATAWPLLGLQAQPAYPRRQIVDVGLQSGPYGGQGLSLAMLREHPSGIDLGPLQPQLPERLRTKDKLIHCDTPEPLADLQRLRQEFAPTPSRPHLLKLIGRRHVRSNNSWMHNYHRLVKGKNRCTLLMHPDDLQQRGIEDGSEVCVRSRVGTLRVRGGSLARISCPASSACRTASGTTAPASACRSRSATRASAAMT